MSVPKDLKALLSLADAAWSASRYEDPAAAAATRKEAVLKIKRHLRDLKRRGAPGLLGELLKKHAFTQKEGLILLMLLRRRISSTNPFLTGQKILKRLNGGSYEILRDTHVLRPAGRLRCTQVVVPRDEKCDPEDILGTEFTLSAWTFRALAKAVEPRHKRPVKAVRAYRRSEDVLLDYLRLLALLQKRANTLFELEDWEEIAPPGEVPARHIQAQIDDLVREMRARLDRTDKRDRLTAVRFIEAHGLNETEAQVVMALVFRELFHGESMAPVVELLKLVSRSKREYLRNLGLFDGDRTLVKLNIVELEEEEEGRMHTAEASLKAWVVGAIVRGTKRGGGFSPDTWQRFRRYLRRLKDSDTFFRDLDKPS